MDKRIADAVNAIGSSTQKLEVFERVYYHKKRVKSVDEIADATGLTREQVLKVGVSLKKSGVFEQVKKDGVVAYQQIEYVQHSKTEILRYVKNPEKFKNALNSSVPSMVQNQSTPLSIPKKMKARGADNKARKNAGKVRLRVAFLTTNPDVNAPLRTDMEMRDVLRKIKGGQNRDLVEFKHLPAAEVSDLLDALNEFKPHIIHFSGHGGGGGILFDNRDVDDDSGWVVDFGAVHNIVSATADPPQMLVFNACDTVQGADVFLETVPMIIAMSNSILDSAATMFSVAFYAAVVAGQPVEMALKQGKAILTAMNIDGADLPTLLVQDGFDSSSIRFL